MAFGKDLEKRFTVRPTVGKGRGGGGEGLWWGGWVLGLSYFGESR